MYTREIPDTIPATIHHHATGPLHPFCPLPPPHIDVLNTGKVHSLVALTQEALCPQSDADFNYLCSPFNLRRLGPCAGLGSTARVHLRAPTVLASLKPIKQDMLSLTSSPVTSLVPFSLNSHSMDLNSYTRAISPPPTARFVLQSELFPLCSFSPPRPPFPSLMVSNLSELEQSNKILLFLAPSCNHLLR